MGVQVKHYYVTVFSNFQMQNSTEIGLTKAIVHGLRPNMAHLVILLSFRHWVVMWQQLLDTFVDSGVAKVGHTVAHAAVMPHQLVNDAYKQLYT